MKLVRHISLIALICFAAILLCACMTEDGSAPSSEPKTSASETAVSAPVTTAEETPTPTEPREPVLDYEALRFLDDGSRKVTVAYVLPNENGEPDPERSGEAVYDLKNTEEETEGPALRFLPESLTGLNDFSLPITDAADRAFLLGELEQLAAPEEGSLPEPAGNPIRLYVDDAVYSFYHTGEILGDGVCGVCSDFFHVSALSYKYLAPDAAEIDLNAALLLYSDGEQRPEVPEVSEENYRMWIVGDGFQSGLSFSQALDFKTRLLGNGFLSGVKTDWDWRQPEGGVCLAETLEGYENRVWLYPDGSVGFLRAWAPEGPWKDGSLLYGQADWDRYACSWQRVYLIENAFDWNQLRQLLTELGVTLP